MKLQNFAMCVAVAVALSGCGNGGGNGSSSTAAPLTAITPVTIAIHAVDKILNEVGDATLQSTDDAKTRVTINVRNEPKGEHQAVFMMYGTCQNLDPFALYPLSDLVDGKSVSTYDLPLDILLNEGPADGTGPGHHSPYATPTPSGFITPVGFAITVWRYTLLRKALTACGDVRLR